MITQNIIRISGGLLLLTVFCYTHFRRSCCHSLHSHH